MATCAECDRSRAFRSVTIALGSVSMCIQITGRHDFHILFPETRCPRKPSKPISNDTHKKVLSYPWLPKSEIINQPSQQCLCFSRRNIGMTSPVTMTTRIWRHSQTWQRSVTHSHEKCYVRYIAGGILFYVGEGLLLTPHPFLRENEQQCLVVFTFMQQVWPHDPDARSAVFLVVPC